MLSLLQLITVLRVLKKNCGLSDEYVNHIMDKPEELWYVCNSDLGFDKRKFMALMKLADLWQSESNLDLFSFGLEGRKNRKNYE